MISLCSLCLHFVSFVFNPDYALGFFLPLRPLRFCVKLLIFKKNSFTQKRKERKVPKRKKTRVEKL